MPTKVEKDALTGSETTGHEWDGIKELNNPLPKWWLYSFYVCVAWSLVYWVLYPSVPGLTGYVKGVIGGSNREALVERMAIARARQADIHDRIEQASLEGIVADPALSRFAFAGGRAAFADNCAPCHGLGGAGRSGGYPTLADDDWLWGGSLEEIHFTLLHGIRAGNDDTRDSLMPAFGADEILSNEEIRDVAAHVLSLSAEEADQDAAARGSALYAEHCAACHGDDGAGEPALGAPSLRDRIWLYGGTETEIAAQIAKPRHGVMPAWADRLDDATIKMLTTYVYTIGGGQ